MAENERSIGELLDVNTDGLTLDELKDISAELQVKMRPLHLDEDEVLAGRSLAPISKERKELLRRMEDTHRQVHERIKELEGPGQ